MKGTQVRRHVSRFLRVLGDSGEQVSKSEDSNIPVLD